MKYCSKIRGNDNEAFVKLCNALSYTPVLIVYQLLIKAYVYIARTHKPAITVVLLPPSEVSAAVTEPLLKALPRGPGILSTPLIRQYDLMH